MALGKGPTERGPQRARVRTALEAGGGVALVVGIGALGNALALWLVRGGGAPVAFMALGVLLAAAGLAAQHRRLAAICRSPAFLLTLIVAGAAVLGVVALGLASVVNARHFRRIDLTGSELYTLNEQTVKILRSVRRPLRIIGAMVPHPNPRTPIERFNNLIRARTDEVLREYAAQSPHVEFSPLDLYADPQSRSRIEATYQVQILRDSVLFVYETEAGALRTKAFQFRELAAHSPVPGVPPRFKGEAVFTGGLQALVEGATSKVCFVTQHGERSIEEFDGDGLSELAEAVRNDNCEVRSCTLPAGAGGCDVLVVAGPRRALLADELEAVRKHVAEGGGLVVLLDPAVGDMRESGLEGLLAELGVRVAADLVIIEESRLQMVRGVLGSTPSVRIETADYPKGKAGRARLAHPVTSGLSRIRTLYYVACPVAALPGPEGRADPFAVELVRTSARSGGKRGFEPSRLESLKLDRKKDAPGPFSIAVARGTWLPAGADAPQGAPPPGRLVVFGDSDFVTNAYVKQGATGNLALFRNAVAWTAGREYKVGIPPKPLEMRRRLDVTEHDKSLARWAVVVVPPFHILLVGIVVWWVRRR